jgi:hypothetical protein
MGEVLGPLRRSALASAAAPPGLPAKEEQALYDDGRAGPQRPLQRRLHSLASLASDRPASSLRPCHSGPRPPKSPHRVLNRSRREAFLMGVSFRKVDEDDDGEAQAVREPVKPRRSAPARGTTGEARPGRRSPPAEAIFSTKPGIGVLRGWRSSPAKAITVLSLGRRSVAWGRGNERHRDARAQRRSRGEDQQPLEWAALSFRRSGRRQGRVQHDFTLSSRRRAGKGNARAESQAIESERAAPGAVVQRRQAGRGQLLCIEYAGGRMPSQRRSRDP